MDSTYIFIGVFLYFALGIMWGAISSSLMSNKGYKDTTGWFILGFLLGIIGLIIAAVQPNQKLINALNSNNQNQNMYNSYNYMWTCQYCGANNLPESVYCGSCGQPYYELTENQWQCSCGAINQSDTDFCYYCGEPKTD